jgi:4-hydroxy-2-oxoheptanedioate aldolase
MNRIGTVLSSADPVLAEAAGDSLDLAWIDLEHGAITVRDAQLLALALQGRSCQAFARLPPGHSETLPALLDCGIDGVVSPRCETPEEAAALVARLRYPPRGTRGFGPRRAGNYGRIGSYWQAKAATVECMVLVESAAGVSAASEIAAVDGVDALVVGCADLTMALGAPGVASAELRAALERVADAAEGAGVAFGLAVDERLLMQLDQVPEIVVCSVDLRLYAAAVDGLTERLRRRAESTCARA